jgi:hypothetical protein
LAVSLLSSLSGWAYAQPILAQASAQNTSVSSSATLPQPSGSSNLDAYIKNYDYAQLAKAVDAMPQSSDRDYFGGVLANRSGRVAESIELLTRVLPRLESSQPKRAAVALQSLADDYVKTYRYNDAIKASEELLHRFASQLDKVERQDEEDGYHTELLLRDAVPQTISFSGKVDVPIHRNPLTNTVETNLAIDGVNQAWILDTGAALSTASASFAARLGVRLSHDAAQIEGASGAENKLSVALLPEMKLGGATVRNVVLLVRDDENLNMPTGKKTHYQIDAILGFPVAQARVCCQTAITVIFRMGQ